MGRLTTAFSLFFCNPKEFLIALLGSLAFLFPDKLYLQILYWLKLGRRLNLDNPRRFTEKLQWLKLYDRNPLYPELVDKERVKVHIKEWIGEKYLIPTYGVWEKFDDINFSDLPNQFVLKTTNGGGGTGIVICSNKDIFNMEIARNIINRSLKQDIYPKLREWPYKNIPHRIIAEKYMEDETGELRDYKFFCFDGVPKVLLVASNRFTNHNFNYYDMDFRKLPIVSVAGNPSNEIINKPSCFDEMKFIASRLSQGMPHVRVDLYSCKGMVYFGELTFYDSSGFDNMSSDYWDLLFGKWLTIPLNKED